MWGPLVPNAALSLLSCKKFAYNAVVAVNHRARRGPFPTACTGGSAAESRGMPRDGTTLLSGYFLVATSVWERKVRTVCTFGKLVFYIDAPFHNKERYQTKMVTK